MLAALILQSPEIQKILVFEGVFEKLFSIVTREGGLEGGLFVEDVLKCVDTLLRYNASNQVRSCPSLAAFTASVCDAECATQSYFRETNLPALLCTPLYFSPNTQPHEPVPQEFALQFWNSQKAQ